MLNRVFKSLLGIVLLSWLIMSHAEVLGPDEMVRTTTNDVITIVKQDKDIKAGNKQKIYDLVQAKILPYFDFRQMTQLAVGRHWRLATPQQQAKLVDQFQTMMVQKYAAALSSVSDYKVDFKPVRMQPGDDDVRVSTSVSKPGMAPVTIDYRMDKQNGGWKVYDVLVDGASLVIANRSSFNLEVKNGGIEGLIAAMERLNKRN